MLCEIRDIVHYFGYRTASPSTNGLVFRVNYSRGDTIDLLHKELSDLSGWGMDNHQGWVVTSYSNDECFNKFLYYFKDWRFSIYRFSGTENWASNAMRPYKEPRK